MKTRYDILAHFIEKSITDKGAQFERLILRLCSDVWLWKSFPSRLVLIEKNAGAVLLRKTYFRDLPDIEDVIINKSSVDSFQYIVGVDL